ncbi:MAG: hypothetical protein O2875_08390 [Planctomycetota bacterium]|nr:hypothetical protein [Planctomycetota bacterium]MDA1263127.1 hypothetical protein [Planctomycetota bacterium]
MKPTLEVPVDSIAGAMVAAPFADRLELCDDLASEGWTPTMPLVREARASTNTSLVVMIRPRLHGSITSMTVAGFTATPQIIDASIGEIERAAAAGAHSVAIGLLTADGFVDMDACGKLSAVARSAGLEVAFLRTFDLLTDRTRGMRDISALGMKRVVTAGVLGWDASVATLEQRIAVLAVDARNAAQWMGSNQAAVEIVPGGGVRSSNARDFMQVSPHLHASCRRGGIINREELNDLKNQMALGITN